MRAPKRSNVINPLRPVKAKSQGNHTARIEAIPAKLITACTEINYMSIWTLKLLKKKYL